MTSTLLRTRLQTPGNRCLNRSMALIVNFGTPMPECVLEGRHVNKDRVISRFVYLRFRAHDIDHVLVLEELVLTEVYAVRGRATHTEYICSYSGLIPFRASLPSHMDCCKSSRVRLTVARPISSATKEPSVRCGRYLRCAPYLASSLIHPPRLCNNTSSATRHLQVPSRSLVRDYSQSVS